MKAIHKCSKNTLPHALLIVFTDTIYYMMHNDNSLIHKYPDLVNSEWDYEKNEHDNINVSIITFGSNIKAWWHCSKCKSKYQMAVSKKTSGRGCPYCSGRKVLKGYNDLASCYPDLISNEWDWNRNKIQPDCITSGSEKKAWWHCKTCDGSYEMSIYSKTEGSGCPYCTNQKVLIGYNDLQTKYPKLIESEWDYEKNNMNGLKPDGITYGSNRKAWWRCNTCHGSYEMTINSKTRGRGCPFCTGKQILEGYNDLASQHPDLVTSEWDWVRNDKNNLRPNEITPYSNKTAWWHCNHCNGSYEMSIYHKTSGIGCPYCAGKRVLTGFNDLQTACPLIASEWYQPMNGNITPSMITKGSKTIRIPDPEVNPKKTISVKPAWKCSKCGHIWRTTVNNRTSIIQSGCPACAKRISKQENQVADFIRNHLCTHYDCMNYTMFRSIKFKRIYELLGIHTENALSDSLQSHLMKELDIYIPELGLAIEYDGDYWHSDKIMMETRGLTNDESHRIKQELCEQAGITLLIITEHDWLTDTENVMNTIMEILMDKTCKQMIPLSV